MSKDKATPRIHVVSDSQGERSRPWSDEQKLELVRESQQDGIVLAQLARRRGISPSRLYHWRYLHRLGLLGSPAGFSPVIPVAEDVEHEAVSCEPAPGLVVDVGQRFRVTVPSGFDMTAAASLLRRLA